MFSKLKALFLKKESSPEILHSIEQYLYEADFGVAMTSKLMEQIQKNHRLAKGESLEDLKKIFIQMMAPQLKKLERAFSFEPNPIVIFLVGPNGAGKTTTLIKIASLGRGQHKRSLLIGADTFRAAAQEQLKMACQKHGFLYFGGSSGQDPSAVIYEGLERAQKEAVDLILVDTAGRLPTTTPLMDELKKMKKVASRVISGAPHERWMVLDAAMGQNAFKQCQQFHEAIELTGILITKLDSGSKVGMVASLGEWLSVPILYLTFGEDLGDIVPYRFETYLNKVLFPAKL